MIPKYTHLFMNDSQPYSWYVQTSLVNFLNSFSFGLDLNVDTIPTYKDERFHEGMLFIKHSESDYRVRHKELVALF